MSLRLLGPLGRERSSAPENVDPKASSRSRVTFPLTIGANVTPDHNNRFRSTFSAAPWRPGPRDGAATAPRPSPRSRSPPNPESPSSGMLRRTMPPGLIERYRERLPFAAGDPVVSLNEGSTPLVLAPRLSERVKTEVWLKIEGANPTGSFKDRGMTCAVSAAVREGAEAVVCASTGNTAASAAAYAARAGLRGVVIVPEGKIATGKLAQALMHGARVIALRGNFDEALKLVRELANRHPIALVNSVNEFRVEGQKTAAFEVVEDLAGELDALCIPVGNAGNISAYWKGFVELGYRPRMLGFQAEGAAPLVRGAPVEYPETVASAIRIGNPARWEQAMDAMTSSGGAVNAVSDRQILEAYRFLAANEGVFCEPASAASVAGLMVHGARDAQRVVCVLTGHGLKDPQVALEQAGAVFPCDPELGAIERAVLG
jgi:threonine synthase